MMNKNNRNVVLLLLLIGLYCFSCLSEINPKWNTKLATPLLKTSFNLENLIENELITTDSSGLLVLHINENIFQLGIVDIIDDFELELDTVFGLCHPLTAGNQLYPESKMYEYTDNVDMDLTDVSLNQVVFKAGKLRYVVINKASYPIVCEQSFVSTYNANGDNIQLFDSIKAYETKTIEIDISGFTFDLSADNYYNCFPVKTVLWSASFTDTVYAAMTDSVFMNCQFHDVELSKIKGYFGKHQYVSGSTSSNLDIFNNLVSTGFSILNPVGSIIINNTAGVDAIMTINDLSWENTYTNANFTLQSSFINRPLTISRAMLQWNNNLPFTPSVYAYPLSVSEVNQLFTVLPDKINYDIDLQINPIGDVTSGNDFLYSDYPMSINYKMDLPIQIKMDQITFVDTFDNALYSTQDLDKISQIELICLADNYFPFDLTPRIILLDDLMMPTDTINIDNQSIEHAIPNALGIIQDSTHSRLLFVVDEEAQNNLIEAPMFKVELRMKSIDNQNYYDIYSHYKIDFQLTTKINYLVDTE